MTAWANRQRRMVARIVDRMGVDVVFSRTTAGTFTPLTGTTTGGTTTTQTVSCTLEPEVEAFDTSPSSARRRTLTRTAIADAADLAEFTPARGDVATPADTGREMTVTDVETIHDGKAVRISLSRTG